MPPRHPAKYSKYLIPTIKRWTKDKPLVLDPLAGVGSSGLPFLHGELEYEWAAQCPLPAFVADAKKLPFPSGSIPAICTSPVYGNRVSDHHDAKDSSKRYTYRHTLNRPLHPDNTGQLQWGKSYRKAHRAIWRECWRVLEPGGIFILNISDHMRDHKRVHVSKWHYRALLKIGFHLVIKKPVRTKRMKHGANRNARVPYEYLLMFSKPK